MAALRCALRCCLANRAVDVHMLLLFMVVLLLLLLLLLPSSTSSTLKSGVASTTMRGAAAFFFMLLTLLLLLKFEFELAEISDTPSFFAKALDSLLAVLAAFFFLMVFVRFFPMVDAIVLAARVFAAFLLTDYAIVFLLFDYFLFGRHKNTIAENSYCAFVCEKKKTRND